MIFRKLLLFAFLSFLAATAMAQELKEFTVRGTIFKKNSPQRLGLVTVTNLRTGQTVNNTNLGDFAISVRTYDTLFFKKIDYAPQQYVVTSNFDINIYLQPVIMLQTVTIQEQSKKQEIADAMKSYKNQGGYSTLDPNALQVIMSPLTGLSELFGGDAKRARRFQKYTRDDQEMAVVNSRFTPSLIKKITGMTDDKDVDLFIITFRPLYADIKSWNEYDMITYIKKSYVWFNEHKSELKLPDLSVDTAKRN
jgi:hypothetical protein